MLIVIGLIVVVGIAIFLTSGPSAIDRIQSARSCSELLEVFGEMSDEGIADAVDTEFDRRARQLGCGQ